MRKAALRIFGVFALFFYACAQQVAPTGGTRDETPPEILTIQPPQEQLNYQAEPIEIEFDEFISLKQLNQQLLTSPPLKYDLETTVKGKTLRIEIQDTLKANTTYVLNFGDAIVDYRESNPLKDFQYVFSTGNVIDTLQLNGRLVDAFTKEVVKDALVVLYDTSNLDSLPYKQIPKYVSRTNEDGSFKLRNLKEGTYSVFSLSDENTNYLFDKPDEKVAFLDSAIRLNSKMDSLRLYSFLEDREQQFVKSQKESAALNVLVFNRKIDSLTFSFVEKADSTYLLHHEISKGRDSLLLWFEVDSAYKSDMILATSFGYVDTIGLKFDTLDNRTLKLIGKPEGKHPYYKAVQLNFSRPLKTITDSLIQLRKADSTLLAADYEIDSLRPQQVIVKHEFETDSTYMLQLLPGAVNDLFGTSHDTLSMQFGLNSAKSYGNLYLTVNYTDSIPLMIQLLGRDQNVLRQLQLQDNKASFSNLKAGAYGLKLIVDENRNQQWDTGDFSKKRQAEKVFIYEGKITIRANWDQEIEWVIKK